MEIAKELYKDGYILNLNNSMVPHGKELFEMGPELDDFETICLSNPLFDPLILEEIELVMKKLPSFMQKGRQFKRAVEPSKLGYLFRERSKIRETISSGVVVAAALLSGFEYDVGESYGLVFKFDFVKPARNRSRSPVRMY